MTTTTIPIDKALLPEPLVLTLGNLKGGVGKSTSAFFLASYFATIHNLRVLVIDADPLSQTSYSWYKRLLKAEVEVPFTVVAFPSVHIDQCVNDHRADYDVIIIDAGGESADILKAAIPISDEVMLLAGATWADMRRIPSTFKAAREACMDLDRQVPVRILMTKCPVTIRKDKDGTERNISSEYLLHRKRCEESNYEVFEQYISNVKWYREAADAPAGEGAENPLDDLGEYRNVGDEILLPYLPEEVSQEETA